MRKYGTQGKEIFGTLSKAVGLEYLSVTIVEDNEFLQVQGSQPVLKRGHVDEFESEVSQLQGDF